MSHPIQQLSRAALNAGFARRLLPFIPLRAGGKARPLRSHSWTRRARRASLNAVLSFSQSNWVRSQVFLASNRGFPEIPDDTVSTAAAAIRDTSDRLVIVSELQSGYIWRMKLIIKSLSYNNCLIFRRSLKGRELFAVFEDIHRVIHRNCGVKK